jgi:multiple sugar transport system permease protein
LESIAPGLAEPPGPATLSQTEQRRKIVAAVRLFWIIAAMTKDNGQLFSTFGLWFTSPPHFIENLVGLYQGGIFLRWFGNSLVYAGSITLGSTLICAMGGYAFSKYDFPAKQFLFNFILGTIMVPSTALVLPLFLMLNKVGLVNTMWGVILPSLVNPFGLYLMKTFWDSGFPNKSRPPVWRARLNCRFSGASACR